MTSNSSSNQNPSDQEVFFPPEDSFFVCPENEKEIENPLIPQPSSSLKTKDADPIVKYSNVIVKSAQRLSLAEQRIIFIAIAQIPANKPITVEDEFFVSSEQYLQLCSFDEKIGNSYRDLRAAAKNLYHRTVTVSKEDSKETEITEFGWVSSITYLPKSGRLKIRFNYEMIPYINLLRAQFTLFHLNELTGFRSSYTQPLYSRLMLYMRDTKTHLIKPFWQDWIGVEQLMELLGAPKYKYFSDFQKRVLEVAKNQINESPYTRFSVKYEVDQYIGKRATRLHFKMTRKDPKDPKVPKDKNAFSFDIGITKDQAVLSDVQVGMYADYLTANTNSVYKFGLPPDIFAQEFYNYLISVGELPKSFPFPKTDKKSYKDWMIRRLSDPEFVQKIYDPWLRKVQFKPKKAKP